MGEHEDRSMKDGVVAPPPFPLVVLPGAALWSKLVAPHDLGADARPPVTCEGLVNPRVSARLALHRVESSCGEEPLHQSAGGVSEGGIETLSLPRAKPIKGIREVVYAHLRHSRDLPRTPLPYLYRLTTSSRIRRRCAVYDYANTQSLCKVKSKRSAFAASASATSAAQGCRTMLACIPPRSGGYAWPA